MRSAALLLAATLLAACAVGPVPVDPDSDAPDVRVSAQRPVPVHASYAQALMAWRTPDDVNDWIGARFEYDRDRALALSESQRERGPAPAHHHSTPNLYRLGVFISGLRDATRGSAPFCVCHAAVP